MQICISLFNSNYLLYGGTVGILLGLLLLIYFLYRRIRWIILTLARRGAASPGRLASLRSAVLMIIWTSTFGMIMFMGFFLRAYYAFTYEEPVAEISIQSSDAPDMSRVTLVQFIPDGSEITRHFLIKGDQWMIEGDILKWDNWLNFLGLHTRYRLTRLRGRYVETEAEIQGPHTIYSLVENENHPLWRYLYRYGQRLPFVSTVYGNAVFQTSGKSNRYAIYVGISGFIVRQRSGTGDLDG